MILEEDRPKADFLENGFELTETGDLCIPASSTEPPAYLPYNRPIVSYSLYNQQPLSAPIRRQMADIITGGKPAHNGSLEGVGIDVSTTEINLNYG